MALVRCAFKVVACFKPHKVHSFLNYPNSRDYFTTVILTGFHLGEKMSRCHGSLLGPTRGSLI